jgi:hypothetical protein
MDARHWLRRCSVLESRQSARLPGRVAGQPALPAVTDLVRDWTIGGRIAVCARSRAKAAVGRAADPVLAISPAGAMVGGHNRRRFERPGESPASGVRRRSEERARRHTSEQCGQDRAAAAPSRKFPGDVIESIVAHRSTSDRKSDFIPADSPEVWSPFRYARRFRRFYPISGVPL